MQRHHQLLEGGIAGPFADAIDRAFELTCTVLNGLEEIGHGQAEIVVAVHRDHGIADVGHVLIDASDQRTELRGGGVADGVGNVDRGGTRGNRRLNHLVKELRIAAAGVFTGELNILHKRAGVAHHLGDDAEHIGTALAQLVLEVDVAGGDEGVNAATRGWRHGIGAGLDVGP